MLKNEFNCEDTKLGKILLGCIDYFTNSTLENEQTIALILMSIFFVNNFLLFSFFLFFLFSFCFFSFFLFYFYFYFYFCFRFSINYLR